MSDPGGNFLNLMLTLSCPLLSWPCLSYGTIMQTGMWRGSTTRENILQDLRSPVWYSPSSVTFIVTRRRVENNGGQLASLCVTFLHFSPSPPPIPCHNTGLWSHSGQYGDIVMLSGTRGCQPFSQNLNIIATLVQTTDTVTGKCCVVVFTHDH